MKRFISILLSLLMLSSLLVGCGGNGAESSITESGTEGEPQESSKTEELKPVIITGDPSYANVALNKTYKVSDLHPKDAPSYPDEDGKGMTDGIRPSETAKYSDKAYMGFSKSSFDYDANGYSSITVDLGGIYYLDKFVASTASCAFESVGIDAPEFVWIYLSNDGKSWYRAGKTSHVNDPKKNTVETVLTLESAYTAQYVQYRFAAGAGSWIFVSEVEAYGIKADEAMPYPDQTPEKKILFVGNSTTYFFNIPDKLFLLCEAAGMSIKVEYCCGGGAYLSQYANASSDLGKLFRNKLNADSYDYVVLQDNGNADNAESDPALDILVPLIRAKGAEVVLYKRYSSNSDPAQRLNSAYRHEVNYSLLAKTFSIEKVAPGADAYLICTEKYPEINLYHTDDSHHNHAGAYLMACVFAITYLDLDVTDNSYLAGLDEATAKALKECAKLACEQGYDYPQDNK